eukprot:scaffold3806_cov94-Isochrysis_galbana.AAC.14
MPRFEWQCSERRRGEARRSQRRRREPHGHVLKIVPASWTRPAPSARLPPPPPPSGPRLQLQRQPVAPASPAASPPPTCPPPPVPSPLATGPGRNRAGAGDPAARAMHGRRSGGGHAPGLLSPTPPKPPPIRPPPSLLPELTLTAPQPGTPPLPHGGSARQRRLCRQSSATPHQRRGTPAPTVRQGEYLGEHRQAARTGKAGGPPAAAGGLGAGGRRTAPPRYTPGVRRPPQRSGGVRWPRPAPPLARRGPRPPDRRRLLAPLAPPWPRGCCQQSAQSNCKKEKARQGRNSENPQQLHTTDGCRAQLCPRPAAKRNRHPHQHATLPQATTGVGRAGAVLSFGGAGVVARVGCGGAMFGPGAIFGDCEPDTEQQQCRRLRRDDQLSRIPRRWSRPYTPQCWRRPNGPLPRRRLQTRCPRRHCGGGGGGPDARRHKVMQERDPEERSERTGPPAGIAGGLRKRDPAPCGILGRCCAAPAMSRRAHGASAAHPWDQMRAARSKGHAARPRVPPAGAEAERPPLSKPTACLVVRARVPETRSGAASRDGLSAATAAAATSVGGRTGGGPAGPHGVSHRRSALITLPPRPPAAASTSRAPHAAIRANRSASADKSAALTLGSAATAAAIAASEQGSTVRAASGVGPRARARTR